VPQKPDGQKLISLSFDQADIDNVLRFLAEQSGKTIVKDPGVQAKVTIVSTAKITVADAFRILGAVLSVKGFSVIDDDDIVRVVSRKSAFQGPPPIQAQPGAGNRADQYITQIIQIEHIDATKLKEDLKPLVPDDQGILVANADTNTLVLIGTATNVSRLADIIKQLDTDRAEATTIEVITLQFADADELATELKELFQKENPLAGLPPEVRQRMMQGGGMPGGPGGPGGAPAAGGSGLMDVRGQVRIVAEKRNNALVVSASKENLKNIKEIVAKLDVDTRPQVAAKLVKLQYADARTLSDQLNSLYEDPDAYSRRGQSPFARMFGGGFGGGGRQTSQGSPGLANHRTVPDVRTNSLIVTADKENMQQILDMVKDLDVPSQVAEVVKAIPLENAVAATVADTLTNLLRGQSRGRGFFAFLLSGSNQNNGGQAPLDQLQNVSVVADAPTNTIILTGPKDTFEVLEKIIKQLDRRVPQVYIEVLIVDVTLDDTTRLGVQWSLIDKNLLGSGSATGTLGTIFDGLAGAGVAGLSYSIISNSVQAFLRTLDSRNDVQILSTPNVIATDNTPATISIGESIPYLAASQQTTVGGLQQTVQFIEVANKLVVTPHVNQRQRISLDVNQTVDALLSFDERLQAPRIAKRQAQTTVEVSDGQTIIIGGIISKQRSLTIEGVPFLRKLPIIGPLFEDKTKEEKRSELLVFLTPHIIMDEAQVKALTDERSSRTKGLPLTDPDLKPLKIPPPQPGELGGPSGYLVPPAPAPAQPGAQPQPPAPPK
jgi:general secretion pathway protein D